MAAIATAFEIAVELEAPVLFDVLEVAYDPRYLERSANSSMRV